MRTLRDDAGEQFAHLHKACSTASDSTLRGQQVGQDGSPRRPDMASSPPPQADPARYMGPWVGSQRTTSSTRYTFALESVCSRRCTSVSLLLECAPSAGG